MVSRRSECLLSWPDFLLISANRCEQVVRNSATTFNSVSRGCRKSHRSAWTKIIKLFIVKLESIVKGPATVIFSQSSILCFVNNLSVVRFSKDIDHKLGPCWQPDLSGWLEPDAPSNHPSTHKHSRVSKQRTLPESFSSKQVVIVIWDLCCVEYCGSV